MLRIAQSRLVRPPMGLLLAVRRQQMSTHGTKPSPPVLFLEGDAGALATRVHHTMTMFLAVATPFIFTIPDRWVDSNMNKFFGVLLAVNISAHSWIGLNYVATDYVPKISKTLLGPFRYVNAGIGIVTLLGLTRIALADGSIKGAIKGLWNPKKTDEGKK